VRFKPSLAAAPFGPPITQSTDSSVLRIRMRSESFNRDTGHSEEEDERVYADFAEGLKQDFPASASVFDAMRGDESGRRRRLIELYRQKFGEHIPLIRRQDVKGFVPRKPVWLVRPLGLDAVRRQASAIEVETRRLYEKAAMRAQDASVRQLLLAGLNIKAPDPLSTAPNSHAR
jgi:Rubrerythrin